MQEQVLWNNKEKSPVLLNAMEGRLANHLQQICNSLDYEINVTTLTAITKKVTEQKFFTIAPSEYMPVLVGNGAWSAEITTYRDFSLGGDFETGIINTGAGDSRLAETDSGVDSITVPVINWAKQVSWTIFDLQLAAKSGNWDLVTSKERARKRNWDLGIQKIAFQGSAQNTTVLGLLNQSGVTANSSLLAGYISTLSYTNFSSFVAAVIGDYRANCAYTAMPTHFIIPELDYDGLAAPVSDQFPVNSKLEYLTNAFKTITMNPGFKILPCAYADQANNSAGINKNRYTLLNKEEESLRMDIPVDYTNTLQNTINGFHFQNVGYGQFTGVKAYRPLEMYYIDWSV